MSKKKEVPNDLTPVSKKYTTLSRDLDEMDKVRKIFSDLEVKKGEQKSDE